MATKNTQTKASQSTMPSKDDSTDAVHIRFRDKGQLKQFYCFDCSQTFAATQLLDVFQHYKETNHVNFHSNCLYCHGKVYQYRDGDHQIQYYHNCFRWKQGLDKWIVIPSGLHPFISHKITREQFRTKTEYMILLVVFLILCILNKSTKWYLIWNKNIGFAIDFIRFDDKLGRMTKWRRNAWVSFSCCVTTVTRRIFGAMWRIHFVHLTWQPYKQQQHSVLYIVWK